MAAYEFLGNAAEKLGIWDDRNLASTNLDLLQKVHWDFLEDGTIILSIDDDVATLLRSGKATAQIAPLMPDAVANRIQGFDPGNRLPPP